jgi:voltage-gated potassium channel
MTASAASPRRLGPRAPGAEAVGRVESSGLREAVDQRSERIKRRFEKPIVIAALLVIPIMVLEATATGEPWSTRATVANWLIWGLFAAEVVVMLAIVPDRRRWLREHLLEIAIVLLTPPFLPASLQALRVFRVFRLLRLIAIVRYARRLFTLNGLRYGALIALVTVLAGGAAFAHAESRSTWDGVWWAMTTVTTVGYGDIPPQTDLGRVVAILVMLVGIGFLSLLIGSVSERFLRTDLEQEAEEVERNDETQHAELMRELRAIRERLAELEAASLSPPRPLADLQTNEALPQSRHEVDEVSIPS